MRSHSRTQTHAQAAMNVRICTMGSIRSLSAIHLLFTFIYSLNDIYVAFFVLVTRNDVTVCVSCLFGVCASAVGSEHIAAQTYKDSERIELSFLGGKWGAFTK